MFYYQRLIRVLPLLNKSNHLLTHKIAFYNEQSQNKKSDSSFSDKSFKNNWGKKYCASKIYREMPPIFTMAQS